MKIKGIKLRRKILGYFTSLLIAWALAGCSTAPADSAPASGKSAPATTQEKTIPPQSETKESTDKKSTAEAAEQKTAPTSGATMKVYYLDVGQGDSILIQTPKGDDILIDGGKNDKGDDVVAYLRKYHVDDIDVMIATHADADHIGGLDTVLENVKVESVYMPKVTSNTQTFEDFIMAVKNEGLKFKEAKAGVSLALPGIEAEFVGPEHAYTESNSNSAVLKVTNGNNKFLFTGDATTESEEDMIAAGEDLEADVLKLGHHGASTSTSDDFLNHVKPKFAIVSAGINNQYGHPTAETLQKMAEHNIKVFRTDKQGTIIATSDGQKITFNTDPSKIEQNTVSNSAAAAPKKTTTKAVPKTAVSATQTLKASVDNASPHQYAMIHLTVTGQTGTPFTAVLHYKSKDTTYNGTVGSPLAIRISRASAGFKVFIDVTAAGKTAQTYFVPQ